MARVGTMAKSDFHGTSIHIAGKVIERWKKVYQKIEDWPATLQAIDDYCASYPPDDPYKLSRASLWLNKHAIENYGHVEFLYGRDAGPISGATQP